MNEALTTIAISSVSLKENLGTADITIEGEIPVSDEFDDPIVELFRPIREEHKKKILFSILVSHKQGSISCKLIPSNRRGRDEATLIETAISELRGENGIISEYRQILEVFFSDEKGLKLFLEKVDKVKNSDGKTSACIECNDAIKDFVKEYGLKMPSLKPKVKKSRAQKKAESEAYKAKHPEKFQK